MLMYRPIELMRYSGSNNTMSLSAFHTAVCKNLLSHPLSAAPHCTALHSTVHTALHWMARRQDYSALAAVHSGLVPSVVHRRPLQGDCILLNA